MLKEPVVFSCTAIYLKINVQNPLKNLYRMDPNIARMDNNEKIKFINI